MGRDFKGSSLLELPDSFVMIDIETTGLCPDYDDILEVAGIRVKNGMIESEYSSLIKPPYKISEFITQLTGITNEMMEGQRSIGEVLPEFLSYIGNDIILGHNVHFDINFLYDNSCNLLGKPVSNNFVDTMRLSRLLHREEKHHRLCDVCERYHIIPEAEHRALADCNSALQCYNFIKEEILNLDGGMTSILPKRHIPAYHAKDFVSQKDSFDEANPLFGKVCAFTGTLQNMQRKVAMQEVVDRGGFVSDSVTLKTNYLILGNNDYCKSIKDGKSTKQKKAEKMKLEGYDIEIIPESVFYDILSIYE